MLKVCNNVMCTDDSSMLGIINPNHFNLVPSFFVGALSDVNSVFAGEDDIRLVSRTKIFFIYRP